MGLCESRPEIGKDNYEDAIKFYDVIISINSIKDISKGWKIKLSERFKRSKVDLVNQKVIKIGVIGNSNKGKSFILSKLSKIPLPSGTSIKTEGLSIKYPDLSEYKNRRIILLDSAGLETPVLNPNNDSPILKTNSIKNQPNNDRKKELNSKIRYIQKKSREKQITELFLQNYIIHNSDILIVVVGILTYSEQKLLNRIKNELKRAKAHNTSLYVIHNLMTYTTIAQVENYINEILLKSATFDLEEQKIINTKREIQNLKFYYEINSDPKIFHLIFANEYSDAGKNYNQFTLSLIEESYKLKGTNLQGFDIVESVKERFREVAKDTFENLQGEIKFDESQNLIKLKRDNNDDLLLKQIFIDELGFQNMMANGFEPNYDYYINKNNIIVKIEAPGNCTLESDVEFLDGYMIIKIKGNKEQDKTQNNCFIGRKFGNFFLDIPIKHEEFSKELYIKNGKPDISKDDGIFILNYELEKKSLKGVYQNQKNQV